MEAGRRSGMCGAPVGPEPGGICLGVGIEQVGDEVGAVGAEDAPCRSDQVDMRLVPSASDLRNMHHRDHRGVPVSGEALKREAPRQFPAPVKQCMMLETQRDEDREILLIGHALRID